MRYLSLFSGIEAASVAWEPLGWEPAAFAEIEPFPAAALARNYPHVANLGDVTQIGEDEIRALGPIDIVVGGSPCQDLSIAGKRAGMKGERSGLFFHQMRIFHAARHLCGARFCIWENVPGAFSTNGGRDFAEVVGEMAGAQFGVPRNGWKSAGAAVGGNGLVEWRVLDAQYFGLAQRRKRVFAVLDTGDWSNRPPLLLEPESMLGHPAPSRETGQETSADAGCGFETAGTLDARTEGGGSPGSDGACAGHVVPVGYAPEVSPALKARDHKGPSSDGDGDGDGAPLVCSITGTITHALNTANNGKGCSEDGTGRGVPTIAQTVALRGRDGGGTAEIGGDTATALRASTGGGDKPHILTVHGTQDPDISEHVSHTLGRNSGQENALEGSRVLQQTLHSVEEIRRSAGIKDSAEEEVQSLREARSRQGAMREALYGSQEVRLAVRRLLPVECERLQGFPDNWTAIPWRGKPAEQCPDGPRYKAIGNSMAVPCMRWIGDRIATIEAVRAAA